MQKKILSILALALLTISGCQENKTDQTQDKEIKVSQDNKFDKFKDQFIEEWWKLDPIQAAYAGKHDYDSLLTIPSEIYRNALLQKTKGLKDTLAKFSTETFSKSNQIDYKIIANFLEKVDWQVNTFKDYEWDPSQYNVGDVFAIILGGKHANLDTRLKAILNKLQYVPAYYQAAKANIKNPTIVHTDLAIDQNKGALGVFEQSILDSLNKSSLSDGEKSLFKNRVEAAKKSIEAYVSFLTDLKKTLKPETARSFRIGKDLFDKKFELDIVASKNAEQTYQKALARKKELHHKMAKLAVELWPKYMGSNAQPKDTLKMIKQVIDKIALKHCHRDSFIAAIEKQLPELEKFVNDKKLLTQDPSKPLVVRKTPDYMAGVAGASISAPGPYDKDAETFYNVTPLTNYTPEQAESYLREYNDYTLQVLNIHEAIPGHYTQLVYSNKAPSMIKSIWGNGAMIEGWAVYTELMMLEEGYKNSPEMWLMYYKWNMRVAMNTILDYSLHVLNISEKDGLNMLMNEAFQEKTEATGKWKRATLSQVQLCSYFSGFSDIYELREELKKEVGADKFNLKDFHEQFLSYGSAPVKFIREMMLGKPNK